jgi:MFS family permease
MATDQRRSWLVATALFLMLVLSYSSTYLTMGIFFTPLIKNFGYSHARVSALSTVAFLATALFSWPAGWLLERIDSRFLISAGAVVIAAGFMTASQATHFGPLIAAYAIMGAGIGLGTVIPAAVVITNWFDKARGKAMAFVMSGTTFGGALTAQLGNYLVHLGGLHFAYLGMIVPVLLSVPIVLLVVRTHPNSVTTQARQHLTYSNSMPGYEVSEALLSRSFWMVILVTICFGFVAASVALHLAPFIIKLGYSANIAATALSAFQISAGVTKLSLGALTDRSGVKISIAIAFLGGAVGAMSLVASSHPSLLIIGILGMGMSLAPVSLIPLLLADSMGIRRFATLQGIQGFILFLAVAAGPFVQGWLYDLSGSYVTSFHILAVVAVLGALLTLTCKRYQREQGAELTAPLAPSSSGTPATSFSAGPTT